MRFSDLLCTTYRDPPAEAQTASHSLLLRGSFIRPLSAGIFTYLPLAVRVLHKLQAIIRDEMNGVGGQEILMPVINPAELWSETGRYASIGDELVRFNDRSGRPMVLAMTHEEVVTDLARREISSHRQLPMMLYQIQVKVRDEPRPRGGLLRAREFHMKDAYSFHASREDLDRFYPRVYQAYLNIFRRCGIEPLVVEADSGIMGGAGSHEFMGMTDAGEDTLMRCNRCSYAANIEHAGFRPPRFEADPEPLPVEDVATPGRETIADVASFLNVPESKTMKAVFYSIDGKLVFVAIRGDREVNETKLLNLLSAREIAMADAEMLRRHGMTPGYASPLNLDPGITVIADRSLEWGNNFVAGANRSGFHLKNVNLHRDVRVSSLSDIGSARDGDLCPRCENGVLSSVRGIELGHIFKLGTKYTDALEVDYLDDAGQRRRVIMGCYGIGVGRLMSAIVETHHDEFGIRWPLSVSPFAVHLVSLAKSDPEVRDEADSLYGQLRASGIDTLYDDRPDTSPGVKFNDADLIGCPLRVTVSGRSLKQGGYEMKPRKRKDAEIAPREHAPAVIRTMLESLELLP